MKAQTRCFSCIDLYFNLEGGLHLLNNLAMTLTVSCPLQRVIGVSFPSGRSRFGNSAVWNYGQLRLSRPRICTKSNVKSVIMHWFSKFCHICLPEICADNFGTPSCSSKNVTAGFYRWKPWNSIITFFSCFFMPQMGSGQVGGLILVSLESPYPLP